MSQTNRVNHQSFIILLFIILVFLLYLAGLRPMVIRDMSHYTHVARLIYMVQLKVTMLGSRQLVMPRIQPI
jgi:hypothetical protein